jgi:ribosomal protein S18 acetylase RimI-like enzyme
MPTAEHAPSSAPDYLIRRPHVEDAAEMGEFHVAVWRQTYAGMMSDQALAQLDVSRFAGMWRRIAETAEERESGGNVTRIAQHLPTGALAGFATVGDAREQDAPVPLQLWAINVLAAHQGSGVADRLLTATLGDGDAYLWVVEQNTRAQSFYRRHGFCTDGGRLRDDEFGADEIRMVRLRSGIPCP